MIIMFRPRNQTPHKLRESCIVTNDIDGLLDCHKSSLYFCDVLNIGYAMFCNELNIGYAIGIKKYYYVFVIK